MVKYSPITNYQLPITNYQFRASDFKVNTIFLLSNGVVVIRYYTVGKMIKASAILKKNYQNTAKSIEEVFLGGTQIKRPILRTGQKLYRLGIEMYLLDKVFSKVAKPLQTGFKNSEELFGADANAVYSSI